MTNKELNELWDKINSNPDQHSKEYKQDLALYLKTVDERMKLVRDTYNVKER